MKSNSMKGNAHRIEFKLDATTLKSNSKSTPTRAAKATIKQSKSRIPQCGKVFLEKYQFENLLIISNYINLFTTISISSYEEYSQFNLSAYNFMQ